MKQVDKVRIDKWLWAIRIFKTRTLASDACKAGRVKIEGKSVKPSRSVQIGETIKVQKGAEQKIVKVKTLIANRVGAPLAVKCYEDFSPPPPPRPKGKKLRAIFHELPNALREKGTGRPTKKERRDLDKFKS